MNYVRNYRGAIWTNHALQRLEQRQVSQDLAAAAFNNPQNSKQGNAPGSMQYSRSFGDIMVTVVAKKNERNEWIILSCWIVPLRNHRYHEKEAYRNTQQASFFGKFFDTLKKQLGF